MTLLAKQGGIYVNDSVGVEMNSREQFQIRNPQSVFTIICEHKWSGEGGTRIYCFRES